MKESEEAGLIRVYMLFSTGAVSDELHRNSAWTTAGIAGALVLLLGNYSEVVGIIDERSIRFAIYWALGGLALGVAAVPLRLFVRAPCGAAETMLKHELVITDLTELYRQLRAASLPPMRPIIDWLSGGEKARPLALIFRAGQLQGLAFILQLIVLAVAFAIVVEGIRT